MRFSRKSGRLLAVTDGRILPLSAVPDEAFASGMLGVGFAIEPSAGTVYAPADGRIESIADGKHAYTLLTEDGLEVLIHVGIDTVSLGGEAFLPMVFPESAVKAGDVIARADLDRIREKGFSPIIPVLITNPEQLRDYTLTEAKAGLGGQTEALAYRSK